MHWKNEKELLNNYSHMKPMFDVIRQFIVNNDAYDTDSKVSVEFKANYEAPSFI